MENNALMMFSATAIDHKSKYSQSRPSGVFIGYKCHPGNPVFYNDFVASPPYTAYLRTLDKLKEFLDMLTLAKTNIAVYGKTHTGMTTYLLSVSSTAKLPPAPKEPATLQEVVRFMNRTYPPKLGPLPHPGGCWRNGSIDEHIFICEGADELRVSNPCKNIKGGRPCKNDRALKGIVRQYFQDLY